MKPVACKQHSPSAYSIICTHLRERDGLGYFAIEAEETEPAQAWCEACDVVFSQERGWTDRAEKYAGWKLYCAICYKNRLRSQTLISQVEGVAPVEG